MEDRIYENMCVGCPNEKYCHEQCDVCEDFLMKMEEAGKDM